MDPSTMNLSPDVVIAGVSVGAWLLGLYVVLGKLDLDEHYKVGIIFIASAVMSQVTVLTGYNPLARELWNAFVAYTSIPLGAYGLGKVGTALVNGQADAKNAKDGLAAVQAVAATVIIPPRKTD